MSCSATSVPPSTSPATSRPKTALREDDRRKDEFLATLAHELRNPLAPIRNAVEVLRLEPTESPQLEWARDMIDRQVDQLTRLVDDLLEVSRITRGMLSLRIERVEVPQLLPRRRGGEQAAARAAAATRSR